MPKGNVTLLDLKTVETPLKQIEERVLRRILKLCHESSTHWLTDNVITAFMIRVVELQAVTSTSVTPAEASEIFRGSDTRLLFASNEFSQQDFCDWTRMENVFIPRNIRGDHWILLVLRPRLKIVQGTCCYKEKCQCLINFLFTKLAAMSVF